MMDEKVTTAEVKTEAVEPHVPTPYERTLLARAKDRKGITDYIDALFEDFIEFKGDRLHSEDEAILGGIALFHGQPVTVIGHRKGRTTEENVRYRFGMASPEGYRKALRLMKQAEKFGRPIITFIDTPGAYPGKDAEAEGQSNAIAECLAGMSTLQVPIISIVTGEGSSGGALAIGVADRIWMLENAVYSILSPEGFAAILWKDSGRAKEACDIMKITAQELRELGLTDGIIKEDKRLMQRVDVMLKRELEALQKISLKTLVDNRYRRYRSIM